MSKVGVTTPDLIARHVMDSLHEGCQVIDFDHVYLYVNETAASQAHSTPEKLHGRTMMECFPGIEDTPVFEALRRCLSLRTRERMENELTFPDGSKGWFELRLIPVPEGACILSLDITDSKRTAIALANVEEQFRHAQKMEAVGRLAGGVAHDFNNLLSVVLSYACLVIDELTPEDPVRADVEEIKRAGERGAELTRQLLVFSRRQILEPRIVDLNELIASTEKMLRRLIDAEVALVVTADPALGRVRCDPGQIEQVIMNLVVNARDAMQPGGTLTIETQNVELDGAYAAQHWGVTPGRYAMFAVSDTGKGMDKETREHIFEPFFTTKGQGRGTGLGLSTVFGIVQQSGGHIWVYSEPGQGSTFKVYLPRTDEVRVRTSAPPAVRAEGRETVLLVDDEDALRAVACEVLRRKGYRVLEAHDGEHALAVSQGHPGRIDLLVTDVVMPRMSGAELAVRLVEARPDTRVLFMSGYTGEAIVHHHVIADGAVLLQKPLTPDSLLQKVREVLGVDGT